ncbi:MAG: penicillin acylase family protein [Proteobacteria bacterium]|nr:penicillin acylase family protein [Pseudomonadota bacterium]
MSARSAGVRFAAVAGLTLVVAGCGAERAAREAFPLASGLLRVEGIQAAVEIVRDDRGVPHVLAERERDAWFGLGVAHAQDRLGQMLWLRRRALGRTAEVLGEPGLAADRWARLLDLGGLAAAEAKRLDRPTRRVLESYAAGVNVRLDRIASGDARAPEWLQAAGLEPEPWTPADSLALSKLHAWSLGNSTEASLVLEDLIERLGGVGARPFFPGDKSLDGLPWPHLGQQPPDLGRTARRPVEPLGFRAIHPGSTAFVVAGRRTPSGAPLLAVDLHAAPTAPALYYEAHLRGGRLDCVGVTLPGIPVFWTGRNRQVAWASVHARAVTTDLYSETLRGQDYHDGRRWRPMAERTETIRVRQPGGGFGEQTWTFRATRHGPLLNPLLDDGRAPLALAWTGARPGNGIVAFRRAARARSAEELVKALAGHHEPVFAVVYADSEGAAGVQMAGWLPQRILPSDLVPVPGRSPTYGWRGAIAFDDLPAATVGPKGDFLVVADGALPPVATGRIEWLWRAGDRGRRLHATLEERVARGPVSARDMVEVQTDLHSEAARRVLPALLALAGAPEELDPQAREIVFLLERWNGQMGTGSTGATAYHVLLDELARELFEGPLGEDLLARYRALPHADLTSVTIRILRAAEAGGGGGGWADPARVRDAVRQSLRQAWVTLSVRLGANRERWTWGRVHQLAFGPFVAAGAGQDVFGPFPVGGDASTPQHAEWSPANPFQVRAASIYRLVVDLGAPDQALSVLAPGQSEHPFHPHHGDGIEPWQLGRPRLLVTHPLVVEESAVATLVLEPTP